MIPYLDPLTEQQLGDICNLQQSSQQTEEMLSKRLDQLHQSLATTVVGESLSYKEFDRDYMDLMSVAVEKLTDIEQFVIQVNLKYNSETMLMIGKENILPEKKKN